MSLRVFHILFITVSTLLALGCSALAYGNYQAVGGKADLLVAVIASLLALGFLIYGIWFLKKTRNLLP